ncbi:hypothetical protein ASAP_1398 [Asaia bogorensis]|uniref:Uncharacterized protein n=1 Tax=Asaia bogorensis TaxID=91915 RepID=A0A060QFH3_9PROT|nr:hypothetical protein ASAP_1398 [Asaia bogorensis]
MSWEGTAAFHPSRRDASLLIHLPFLVRRLSNPVSNEAGFFIAAFARIAISPDDWGASVAAKAAA